MATSMLRGLRGTTSMVCREACGGDPFTSTEAASSSCDCD